MAYISVEKDGVHSIGSAFHVGDGIFITARHVLEHQEVQEIKLTNPDLYMMSNDYKNALERPRVVGIDRAKIALDSSGILEITEGPWFPVSDEVDLAAFRVSGLDDNAPFVKLGYHLDDWIGEGDFELSEVLVLGYPPIPFTREPILVAVKSEINATVDLYINGNSQIHFVLSGIPRGGFSGGLALSEWDFALGVVTTSLVSNGKPSETGYFVSTSIEVVLELLRSSGVLPISQTEGLEQR